MMAWLLWARFLVLALLVAIVASFVWMLRSDDSQP
jgi:hypothetical protein